MSGIKTFVLGVCVYFCTPLFWRLARRWEPNEFSGTNADQHEDGARKIRAKFWRAVALITCVIGTVLLARWLWSGGLNFDEADWLRVAGSFVALVAALGRGGWSIQTYDGSTTVERIDRSMYVLGQLGAAALLIFILTL